MTRDELHAAIEQLLIDQGNLVKAGWAADDARSKAVEAQSAAEGAQKTVVLVTDKVAVGTKQIEDAFFPPAPPPAA